MELRLLDCLEQTWLFQRDVVFSEAGDLFPFRKLQCTDPVSFSFHFLLVA